MDVLTKDECKKLLSKLGFKLGVSPSHIATRLLDDNDKRDILEGLVNIASLKKAVEVWRDRGMCDYAHGKTEPYATERARLAREAAMTAQDKPLTLRKPFINYRVND